ncbi:LCP family protein [Kocuria atrinae]|uniref:LytR family transcriptional regulator n=1 Tax=Kocuria atrinae TaxID=592377 RepID=A0ABN2XRY8_9MICC
MESRSAHGRGNRASREPAPWDTPATRRQSLHEDRDDEFIKLKQTGRHHRSRDHRPSARKIAVILTVFGLIAVLGIGGVAALRLSSNLDSSPLNLSDGSSSVGEGPLDILVMGSDTRTGSGNSEYGDEDDASGRTDVMMLVHVTENRDAVTVVSFPRDLVVDIPKCTDPESGEVFPAHRDMINSAVENGGPGCTVATVNEMAGVDIDHFMLADFNAVKELSSTVGGVQVCVNRPVDDPKSGLKLPAGISSVEGDQALAFLRSRAAFGDGGDESRIRSQQSFLASLTRKIQSDGTLNNLPQLYKIAEVMTQNLHVDEGLTSLPTLVGIAGTFAGIDLGRIAFVTVPNVQNPEDPNRLVLDEEPAERLFDTLQQDRAVTDAAPSSTGSAPASEEGQETEAAQDDDAAAAPTEAAATADAAPVETSAPAAPSTAPESAATEDASQEWAPQVQPSLVPITVANRSGEPDRGEEIRDLLAESGYTQAETARTGTALAGTQIFYNPTWATAADDLAALLGVPDSQLVADYELEGLRVSIGQDFTSGEKLDLSGALPDELQGQTAEQFTCQD